MISVIDSVVTPLFRAFSEWNQVAKSLLPLDALQPTQHNAILDKVVILISLIMCSQDFLLALSVPNFLPQYTQHRSRSETASYMCFGIPHEFAILGCPYFMAIVE